MDFDTENFIIEVQNRPAIWNTKSTEYSDKNLRSKAWQELVDFYGADLSQDRKKQLGQILQKKWRNIRDAFVKTHKAKESKRGSVAKKKVPYVFYENLLFIKDTVTVNRTDGNSANEDNTTTKNEDIILSNTPFAVSTLKSSKTNYNNYVGGQLIRVLNKKLEKKNLEDDDDRLFFLSLVKDFKKIPDPMRMQAKLDILRVIKDAQQVCDYSNTSWSNSRPNRGHQTAHYSKNNPCSQSMRSSQVKRPPSQDSANLEVPSPLSTDSQQSRSNEHSSCLELS